MITGGCGFIGSNLASQLLNDDREVWVFDNLSRPGADLNLEWLRTLGNVRFLAGDVRNASEVSAAIARASPDAVVHLAGQVAMSTSLRNPRLDFETNVVGSFNLLEAVRTQAAEATVIFASSNKVYGDLTQLEFVEEPQRYRPETTPGGVDEHASLDFRSPYGCSKGAADQYVLDYARNFGLRTVVFRHSTVYGERQFATEDQGWVGWFCRQALEVRADPERAPFTINGNGKQVRDLLHVSDAVRCYLAAVEHIGAARGQAFNIGGGIDNSMSLLELFDELESRLDICLRYQMLPARPSDQKYFVADISKAEALLAWMPIISKTVGIGRALAWESASGRRLLHF